MSDDERLTEEDVRDLGTTYIAQSMNKMADENRLLRAERDRLRETMTDVLDDIKGMLYERKVTADNVQEIAEWLENALRAEGGEDAKA